MGNSCTNSKSIAQRRHSRFESLTNTWINYGYFEIFQLIKEFSEIKCPIYLRTQHSYLSRWPLVQSEATHNSKKSKTKAFKRLVRQGISDANMRDFIAILYKPLDVNYESHRNAVYPLEIPNEFKHVPTFSEYFNIQDAVPVLYISSHGLIALSRIMWVLSNHNTIVTYSPQIVNFTSILLIFLKEEEAYEVIHQMIHSSYISIEIQEKFFTINSKELGLLAGIITKVIEHKQNELANFFKAKSFCLNNIIVDIIKSFGVGYFPLKFLTRITAIFLVEGNKGLIKILVSIFLHFSAEIMKYTEGEMNSYIKNIFLSVHSENNVIDNAFKIKLSKYKFKDLVPEIPAVKALLYYRPLLPKKFNAVHIHYIEILWSYIPSVYRTSRPVSIYCTALDGFSLKTLLRMTEAYPQRTPMILFFLTEVQGLIGGFLDEALKASKSYFGGSECFVFSLEPTIEVYRSSGADSMHANITDSLINFGGGNQGPAISVNEDLTKGYSYASGTYKNNPLSGGYFNIIACEVFALVA